MTNNNIITNEESTGQIDTVSTLHSLNDVGNGERFAAQHGHHVRYCHPWGKWLIWDGSRWSQDNSGEAQRRAKTTAASIFEEAASVAIADPDMAAAVAKWAAKSHAVERLRAMLYIAESEPGIPVTPNQLDTDPWLLNCLNGTIDLRTGNLLPHDPERLLTKLAPVRFNPGARCRRWLGFLSRIMNGNAELTRFLQRATGYALTGDVSEQVVFILWGAGANGKSTYLNLVMELLGDYATKSPQDLLLEKRGEVHPTEKTVLFGSRMVASIETERGKRLSEVFVKEATGGDPITARRMREDFWTFMPTHKLFLATNHQPVVTGTDHAIWRRIRLVPFSVIIPEAEQDKQLTEKLRAEFAGILAWAVRGCLEWQQDGLQAPPAVVQATAEYRADMDILADFFDENIVQAVDARVTVTDLYAAYRKWAECRSESVLDKMEFGQRIRERGVQQTRTKDTRYWAGVRLLTDNNQVGDAGDTGDKDFAINRHMNPPMDVNPEMASPPSPLSPNDFNPWGLADGEEE